MVLSVWFIEYILDLTYVCLPFFPSYTHHCFWYKITMDTRVHIHLLHKTLSALYTRKNEHTEIQNDYVERS